MVTAEGPTALPPQFEVPKTTSFVTKVMEHVGATITCGLCVLGDRLGLFKALETEKVATSSALAQCTGLKERYVREWLSLLAAAGYLEYDRFTDRFLLPHEHASILGHMDGVYRDALAFLGDLESVTEAFQRRGGFMAQGRTSFQTEIETVSAGWYEKDVLQWIVAIGALQAILESGANVAEIGCATGRALIRMALAFPKSHFVGYEVFSPFLPRATAYAEAAGVADRVHFEHGRSFGSQGLYDLITSFDLLYDNPNAASILRTVHTVLKPAGIYVIVEVEPWGKPKDGRGSISLDGASLFVCTSEPMTSLKELLPIEGGPQSKLSALCAEAGFRTFARVARYPFPQVKSPRRPALSLS